MIPTLRAWHERAHRQILGITADLTDDQLTWKAGGAELPVAWHLWHIGRFADITQSVFCDAEQSWHSQEIAGSWGFVPEKLGAFEAGTGMDQDYASSIDWPVRDGLMDYVKMAVEAAIASTTQVTEKNFDERVPRVDDYPGAVLTYGNILTRFVWHPGRHLGNIETILGLRSRQAVAS